MNRKVNILIRLSMEYYVLFFVCCPNVKEKWICSVIEHLHFVLLLSTFIKNKVTRKVKTLWKRIWHNTIMYSMHTCELVSGGSFAHIIVNISLWRRRNCRNCRARQCRSINYLHHDTTKIRSAVWWVLIVLMIVTAVSCNNTRSAHNWKFINFVIRINT